MTAHPRNQSEESAYRFESVYDANGVDISLIREMLALSPLERLRRTDRARRDEIALMNYGQRARATFALIA